MATIFRTPVITRIPRRELSSAVVSQDGVTSNRLLDLLLGQDTFYGAPGQVPDYGDFPVPRGPVFPMALRTLAVCGVRTVFKPCTTHAWVNPVARRWSPSVWPTPPNLLASTLAVVSAATDVYAQWIQLGMGPALYSAGRAD